MNKYYVEKYDKECSEIYYKGKSIYMIDRNRKIFRMTKTKVKGYVHDDPDEHSPWDVGITIYLNNGYEGHVPYRVLKTWSFMVNRTKPYNYAEAYPNKENAIKWFKIFCSHPLSRTNSKIKKMLIKLSIWYSEKFLK